MFIDTDRQAPQDWEAIALYLGAQGRHLDRDVPIRQFASGVANMNYLISLDGRPAVFRRPPNADAPPGAYDFARQHKIQSRLGQVFPLVPLGLAYCADNAVIGVPFLVSEFRDGIAIFRDLPDTLAGTPEIGARLSALMVDAMAQLHAVDPVAAGLSDLGRAEGFIARQIHGWHKRASRVMPGHRMRQMDALKAWLVEHQPAEVAGTIVHLDLKLDNVLVDPRSLTVRAIVDWEMATIGDPFYDLMLTLLVWGEPTDAPVYARQSCMPSGAPGWWTRRRALEAYQRATGRTLPEQDLKFYWLLAMFRNIGAQAQLVALYAHETMPNASSVDFASLLASTLDHAVTLIDAPLDW